MCKGKNWIDFQREKEARRQKEIGKSFLIFCALILTILAFGLVYWQGQYIKRIELKKEQIKNAIFEEDQKQNEKKCSQWQVIDDTHEVCIKWQSKLTDKQIELLKEL